MKPSPPGRPGAILIFALILLAGAAPAHRFMRVLLPVGAPHALSGRLLVLARAAPHNGAPASVDIDEFDPGATTVAAQEVSGLAPGAGVDIDGDALAYPAGFSALPAGQIALQAVLDVHHDYAYSGRHAGDVTSRVVLASNSDLPALSLSEAVSDPDPWADTALASAHARVSPIEHPSEALARFWGRPITLRGYVLTPPGYDARAGTLYPTVYLLPGYGSRLASLPGRIAYVDAAMQTHAMPPMVWVFLDQSSPTGTHEFADSINNGPYGMALTRELVPYVEAKFHVRREPGTRFLTGHSSGGWAALWIMTRFPGLFGGAWATSPDPVDFHDFSGVDLYAPGANMYRAPDGTRRPLMRKSAESIEDVAKLERVLGPTGGQFSSFEWVFSPRGQDGRPEPLFDRESGEVDHDVAAYWAENYDIAGRIASHWGLLKHALPGKMHVIVGTEDTFFLDGPVHRLQAVLDRLGAGAAFTYLPGRGHFDLYRRGDDAHGLLKDIAAAMAKAASAVPMTKDSDGDQ